MKFFVRESERDSWDALRIVVVIGTMMFAAETVGEIAYLPLYAFLAIEFVRSRLWRRRNPRALLGADRSKGSR
jgi:hypothetical protein